MSIESFYRSIYKWCSTEINSINWAFAMQNGLDYSSAASGGLGTINLIFNSQNGYAWQDREYDENLDVFNFHSENAEELTADINIYAKDSFTLAKKLQRSLDFDTVRIQLETEGLGFIKYGNINNLTYLDSSEWNKRAQFEITFYMNLVYTKEIDRIAETSVKGQIEHIQTNQKFNF